ncbi:MAG TPA: ParA family protein [Patescibacteria group bacterium]|jgi:chromosome partitioning protein|nr:ParA family protein [Patescibacteria group bacterium]
MTPVENRQAIVLAVVNRKGGVGKTTTAVNLAHGLSRKLIRRVSSADIDKVSEPDHLYQYLGKHYFLGGHVLVIDFDAQGHCAQALGIDPRGADVGEVLLGRQHLSQAVITADRAESGYPRPNLWLLPASDNLERAKENLYSQSLTYFMDGFKNRDEWLSQVLEKRLHLARERFTYIILDCAPGLDSFAHAVHKFAGMAIVPVKPDYLSMSATRQNTDHIQSMQLRGVDIQIHTIVPTFYIPRQRLDQEMIAELRAKHGDLVGEPIPRSQLAAEAPADQETIFEIDPYRRNPATIAYQNLVDRVYYG